MCLDFFTHFKCQRYCWTCWTGILSQSYLDGSELLFYCAAICLRVNKVFLDSLIISICFLLVLQDRDFYILYSSLVWYYSCSKTLNFVILLILKALSRIDSEMVIDQSEIANGWVSTYSFFSIMYQKSSTVWLELPNWVSFRAIVFFFSTLRLSLYMHIITWILYKTSIVRFRKFAQILSDDGFKFSWF